MSDEAALGEDGNCGACRAENHSVERMWSFGPYRDDLRQTIHLLKYDGVRPLGLTLGERCAHTIGDDADVDLVAAVPLHWTKRWRRGFNQSGLLAQQISRTRGWKCAPRVLRRRRATPAQAGLTAAQRRDGLRGAFEARRELVEGRTVLLVDDVVTTGATIDACARALKKAGAAKVSAVTAARAELARYSD